MPFSWIRRFIDDENNHGLQPYTGVLCIDRVNHSVWDYSALSLPPSCCVCVFETSCLKLCLQVVRQVTGNSRGEKEKANKKKNNKRWPLDTMSLHRAQESLSKGSVRLIRLQAGTVAEPTVSLDLHRDFCHVCFH